MLVAQAETERLMLLMANPALADVPYPSRPDGLPFPPATPHRRITPLHICATSTPSRLPRLIPTSLTRTLWRSRRDTND